jgi:hypothetical protein
VGNIPGQNVERRFRKIHCGEGGSDPVNHPVLFPRIISIQ